VQLRLKRLHPGSIVKEKAGLMLVPRPKPRQIGGPPIKDTALLTWCTDVVSNVLLATAPQRTGS
jgi:transcription-repair coupling factor (superfamily II helicase)